MVEGCGLRDPAREEEGRLHRENRHSKQAANRRGMIAVSPSRAVRGIWGAGFDVWGSGLKDEGGRAQVWELG
jgi:hypothetical protein